MLLRIAGIAWLGLTAAIGIASDPCGINAQAQCLLCGEWIEQNCSNCSSPSEAATFAGEAVAASCQGALIPPHTECSGPDCSASLEPLRNQCRLLQIAITSRCDDGTTKYYFRRRCCRSCIFS